MSRISRRYCGLKDHKNIVWIFEKRRKKEKKSKKAKEKKKIKKKIILVINAFMIFKSVVPSRNSTHFKYHCLSQLRGCLKKKRLIERLRVLSLTIFFSSPVI